MTEHNTGFTSETLTKETINSSITEGIDAFDLFFPGVGTANFQYRVTQDPQLNGVFPARVFPDRSEILIHSGTVDYIHSHLSSSYQLNYDDLAHIYVGAGVVNTLLARRISARNKPPIQQLYGLMSSTDSLGRKLTDEMLLEVGEEETQVLVESIHSRSEESVCEINRLRLAVGVLAHSRGFSVDPSLKDQQSNGIQDVVEVFKKGLAEFISHRELYERTVQAFGVSGYGAGWMFRDELSPVEIACAFPMELPEIERIVSLLDKKR